MSLALKKRAAVTGADPTLRAELRDCLDELRHNQSQYDLEKEPDLIEACIYQRAALLCRYRYLLRRVREQEARP
mgnify:FL=1